jgi:hypothetical protein
VKGEEAWRVGPDNIRPPRNNADKGGDIREIADLPWDLNPKTARRNVMKNEFRPCTSLLQSIHE